MEMERQKDKETGGQGDRESKLPGRRGSLSLLSILYSPFSSLSSLLSLLLKRLRSSPGLSAGIAAGLVAAVALVTCIPLYADGVGHRLLMEQLSGEEARPPFAFLFRYVGAWHGPLEWEQIQAADAYLTTRVAGDLNLPISPVVRHVRTSKWRLFPADEAAYADTRQPLEWLALGFLDDLVAHVDVIEGDPLPSPPKPALSPGEGSGGTEGGLPSPPVGGTEGGLPVLISQPLANRLGLRVGETYILFAPSGTAASSPPLGGD
ncbi:MAG: hypothetical protein SXV54_23470 [Chloroflexota bacterium]|nr:hypothetical protein [Chloroflexota bacterium]